MNRRNARARTLAPIAVLVISLAASCWVVNDSQESAERRNAAAFEEDSKELLIALRDRLADYSQLLEAGRALFAASDSVHRYEWEAFVGSLDLRVSHPAARGFAFVAKVDGANLSTFEREARRSGTSMHKLYYACAN